MMDDEESFALNFRILFDYKHFRLVSEKYFFMNGVCLCLSVLDRDVMFYDDLAGQVFIPLATFKKLNFFSANSLPLSTMSLPLTMPTEEIETESFRVSY